MFGNCGQQELLTGDKSIRLKCTPNRSAHFEYNGKKHPSVILREFNITERLTRQRSILRYFGHSMQKNEYRGE